MRTTSRVSIFDLNNESDTFRSSMYADPAKAASEPPHMFAVLYTTNKLTLAQAFEFLRSHLRNLGYTTHPSTVLNHLGHRFHPQDVSSIELGYDGDVLAWLDAGNTPIGWYSLFSDNYTWYKHEKESCTPKTTEPETKAIVLV